jgi:hypothetical protein
MKKIFRLALPLGMLALAFSPPTRALDDQCVPRGETYQDCLAYCDCELQFCDAGCNGNLSCIANCREGYRFCVADC